MSTFMKRNALFGSAVMFSLLAALHAPVSLAGEGHSEHEQHAAESAAPKTASGKHAEANISCTIFETNHDIRRSRNPFRDNRRY